MSATEDPFRDLAASLEARTDSDSAKKMLQGLGRQLDRKGAWGAVYRPSVYLGSEDLLGGLAFEKPSPSSPPPAEVPAELVLVQRFLDSASTQLRDTRGEIRRRVDQAFTAAMWLGIVGGVAFFVGVGLALSKVVAVGVTSALGGGISAFCSKSFASMYSTENQHLQKVMDDLQAFDQARIGLWLADHMTDPQERDAAIRELVEQIRPAPARVKAPGK